MGNNIIIGLIFVLSASVCQAQNNKFGPLGWVQEKHSFSLPELLVDSVFIINLNAKLFNKNDRIMSSIFSNPKNDRTHFFVYFEKKDSVNYCITASLWEIPARKSIGFFKYNKCFYWFGGKIPPNIILETKSKQRFSYKDPLPGPYDPLFWHLIYNNQNRKIKVEEKDFY